MKKNHEETFGLSGRIAGKLDHLRWMTSTLDLGLSDFDKDRIVGLLNEICEDNNVLFKKILGIVYGELPEKKDETGA